jgi:hypothetical protein
VSVHDIEMQRVGAGRLGAFYLVCKASEISAEQ